MARIVSALVRHATTAASRVANTAGRMKHIISSSSTLPSPGGAYARRYPW